VKTTIKNHLERFGYDYTDHGEILTVRMGFSLQVVIDLSDPEKVRLIDRLKGWNFLTGIIETNLKRAMIFNTIGLIAVALIFILLTGFVVDSAILIIIFTALMGYILLWSLFYLTKAENFKQKLNIWIKDHPE